MECSNGNGNGGGGSGSGGVISGAHANLKVEQCGTAVNLQL